jgi:hypothetical protein
VTYTSFLSLSITSSFEFARMSIALPFIFGVSPSLTGSSRKAPTKRKLSSCTKTYRVILLRRAAKQKLDEPPKSQKSLGSFWRFCRCSRRTFNLFWSESGKSGHITSHSWPVKVAIVFRIESRQKVPREFRTPVLNSRV